MNVFNLKEHELTVEEVFRNLSPSTLYEHAILYEKDAHIAENGALVAYSGVKTGRSAKDKRVVNQSPSKDEVWWGSVNIPLEPQIFAINRERARDYLNSRERLYCFDGFAGVGTRNIASRSVSFARDPITRSSCIRCSSGLRRRSWKTLARPSLSFITPERFRPIALRRAWDQRPAST